MVEIYIHGLREPGVSFKNILRGKRRIKMNVMKL